MVRIAFALGVLAFGGTPFAQDKASSLVKEKEIVLPGGTSYDYVSVDSAGGRVYVAHAPKIDVIDAKKGMKIGEVDGVEGAHGAIAVPEFKRGFATAGRKNKLIVFDLETFKVAKEVDTGQNPDALLYVSSTKEVWTFNGQSKNATCVDASTLEVKATIRLDGQPEAAVEGLEKGVVYVNLEDRSSIAEVDAKKHEVVGTHPLAPGDGPTGLAFDSKHGLLFSGCSNKKLIVVDVAAWKVVGAVDIAQGCDGVVFDPGTSNAIASCTGGVSVVHEKDAQTFEPLPALEAKGRTCALDEKTHKVYIASGPRRGEKGDLKILVLTPKP
jgi:DNA-binding beta-propeller fold protein YncE